MHGIVVAGLMVGLGLGWPRPGVAQDRGATTDERLAQLDQEIRVLKRIRELERDSLAALARTAPRITAGTDGFALRSADGRFQFRARGYFQTDGRFFLNDAGAAATNALILRRARPILEATVFQRFDFRMMTDFAEGRVTVFDAHLDVRLFPALAIRAGKYKPPVGLERLQSATDIRFAERGLPTNLAPNRDVGLQLSGDLGGGMAAYAVGVFDGVPDVSSGDGDAGDDKDFAARVFVQPFRRGPLKGLGVGAGGSTGIERGGPAAPGLAGYRTPGQQPFFRYRTDGTAPNTTVADGPRRRFAPQGFFHAGPVGLLAEYTWSSQDVRRDTVATGRLTHRAWQVSGSWLLTGEASSFRSITPRKPFDPERGAWGAVEIAARVGEVLVDADAFPAFANPDAAARRARSWGVGLNWHLARNVKLVMDYERTGFTGGAPSGANRPVEHFFVTRLQTAF